MNCAGKMRFIGRATMGRARLLPSLGRATLLPGLGGGNWLGRSLALPVRLAFVIATMISAPSPALAQNTVTNVMSPIVSYQYPDDFGSEVLTNGGVISPFVSYQYLENFSSAALTNGGIMSPMVSYQYYEWPGNGILQLVNSPVASYWYGSGGAPRGLSAPASQGWWLRPAQSRRTARAPQR